MDELLNFEDADGATALICIRPSSSHARMSVRWAASPGPNSADIAVSDRGGVRHGVECAIAWRVKPWIGIWERARRKMASTWAMPSRASPKLRPKLVTTNVKNASQLVFVP